MIALYVVAAAAAPTTTYLECVFPPNQGVLQITADEPNQSVTTVFVPTGYSEKRPAAFTPTEVRFENSQLSYVISRTRLTIERSIKMIDSPDSGTCKVVTPPPRAF